MATTDEISRSWMVASNGLRPGTLKRADTWFITSGVLVMTGAVIEQWDPAYWSPVTLLDYTAALLTSVSWTAIAIALFMLWRTTPIRRGASFLVVAAIGFLVAALGNLLEDVLDVEFGVWMFLVGLSAAALVTVVAGVSALTVSHQLRWIGLFLLVYIAGGIAPDNWGEFVSAASLLGLGVWLFYLKSAHPSSYDRSPQAHA